MSRFGGPRHARRRDANEPQLVLDADRFATHRAIKLGIEKIDAKGVPDLVLGMLGRNVFVEVKNPESHHAKERQLTPDQQTWWKAWPGQKDLAETSADMRRIILRTEAAARLERLAPFVADILAGMMTDPQGSALPELPISKIREFITWTRALQETSQ